ncbi:MAG TPA: bifunctional glycosyltransferase/class I SAM-dependent methyltransferase [Acidimicrobiales bacterium]|nr:bifunctional glycosyltransferase/class I SAM-dependent methyltransferase [Acidimicrobiales bacterium]
MDGAKRIGILVVAYNAATTLASTLDRIPPDFRPRIAKVLVGDDHSQDSTYLVGLGWRDTNDDLDLEVVRHPRNLGYGGNQKWGYRWAIEQGLDIVVLLHGDGQYAPEELPRMVAPLERDEADAVFGSRMMQPGQARRGGMPLYKYVGNRILTTVENRLAGLELTEWHSGYRAYSVAALATLPFDRNSDGFDFDTEIILQLKEAGKRIVEVPIPTYYGEEICYVNGLKYAKDIVSDVARYRLHKMGFGSGELAFATTAYELKDVEGLDSSHQRVLRRLERMPKAHVLDLGCSDGRLAERIRELGHEVTGVDIEKHDGVGERVDRFFEADLDEGLPDDIGGPFDVILGADVFEHVRDPRSLLVQCRERLRPGGVLLASVPNFAHWYPRARVALGVFDYDRRGILDAGHLRFFTRRSFARVAERAGLRVRRLEAVGPPQQVVQRGAAEEVDKAGAVGRLLQRLNDATVAARPTLFAYQFLFELEAERSP